MSSRARSFDVNREKPQSRGGPAVRNPSRLICRFLAVATPLLAYANAAGEPIGSRLDPINYTPLGNLMMASGTVTIDTDNLTVSGIVGNGVLATSESGLVEMAVFTFTNISIWRLLIWAS